jgi:hypothetical protein
MTESSKEPYFPEKDHDFLRHFGVDPEDPGPIDPYVPEQWLDDPRLMFARALEPGDSFEAIKQEMAVHNVLVIKETVLIDGKDVEYAIGLMEE